MTDEQNEPEQKRFLTGEEILSAKEPPVVVELSSVGAVHLRQAREIDLNWLREAVRNVDDPRELALAVLRRQWAESGVDVTLVADLPDRDLALLIRTWLDQAIPLQKEELSGLDGLHDAIRATLNRWDEPARKFAESSMYRVFKKLREDEDAMRAALGRMDPFAKMRMVSDIYPHYRAVQRLAGIKGVTDVSAAVAEGAQRAIDQILPIKGPDRVLLDLQAEDERRRSVFGRAMLPPLELTEAITRAHTAAAGLGRPSIAEALKGLAPLQEAAAHTMAMRGVIEKASIGHALSRSQVSVLDGLTDLTRSATGFWNSLAAHPDLLVEISQAERDESIARVFRATRSAGLLVAPEPEVVEARPPAGMLAIEVTEIVPRLQRINPDLVPIYQGALDNFRRRRPDFIRQTTASMRALFENLLPLLAPTDAIRAWDASVLPKKGPVNYKARLTYIYRLVAQQEGYDIMTMNDTLHVEQSLILLDEQVHRMKPSIAEEALSELLIRWEYSLQHVLRTYERSLKAE